jgi:2-amino-4-hydroxy-6-hydroxymethyldihydropteridine diphosphokinase
MSIAFLGLGSNVDAERNVGLAIQALIQAFKDAEISPIYRSKAVGFEGDDFINLVVRVRTDYKPMELRAFLRRLEDRYGRDREAPKWSDRTLDIDILLFDNMVVSNRQLVLPRPEILRFAHVLKPLADIAPDLVHPLENRTFGQLWQEHEKPDHGLVRLDPGLFRRKTGT